jgi:hypothetical protein
MLQAAPIIHPCSMRIISMLSAPTDAKTAGGIYVERAFSWTPEIMALMVGWVGLWCVTFGIVRPYHKDATLNLSLGAILISVALVLLGFRFVQRRRRLRVVAFPERNYAEIFSDDNSPQQVPLQQHQDPHLSCFKYHFL